MAYLDPEFSPLPKGWSAKELSDVVEIRNTKRQPLNGRERESRKGIYPYCGANGVVDYIDDYRFDGEYVLIAEDGGYWGKHQPSSYIMRGKFWVNNHAHVVCAKDGETTNVFFSNIVNYLNIDPFIGGDARGKLTKAILTQLAIPLPPLPEQKKIAHILSTVQRAIEAQERIIQTTSELKKALMHKLFTEGLRNEPQKQTEIGPVPVSWEVVGLVTLLREPLRNGHSAKATTDEDGIRTLTLTAVTQRDFSIENTKVTCADPHRVRDMWLKSGDIFIERANTADYVGLAALYEGDEEFAIFPDLLIRVRVDTGRILPKVLIEWLLAEPCRRYYKKNARSTAGNFPKIDQGTVEKTLIPVPPADEQAELESSFRMLDDKLRQHILWKAALQDLFRTLLHELMTAKIRVANIDLANAT